MTTRFLLAIAILASVAACKIGGDETNTGAAAACFEVGTACAGNSDCCSYGCLSGICAENPAEGGTCRTTNDCIFGRLCKSGACTTETPAMCRDTADVCTSGYSGTLVWGDCCSGNCEAGRCTTNNAPVVNAGPDITGAPYTKPVTLTNLTADADGDPLTYGWSFTSAPVGSTATFVNPAATNQTFTPNRPGRYVVRLVVTEGPAGAPDRYVLQDEVTIDVVNTLPVVTATMPASAATWSRNVTATISGTATDADGDTLECVWRVTAPGETTPTVQPDPCNPSSPSFVFKPTLEGPYAVDLVVRDRDRVSNTVVHEVVATAAFTSVNDAPVADVPAIRAGNIGPNGTPGTAIPIVATATDVNGDTAFTWTWTFDQVPPLSTLTSADIVGANTASVSFAPDAMGFDAATRYVLRVTVCDAAPACSEKTVAVNVYRHVAEIEGPIADADWAAGSIFAVGTNPLVQGEGKLWVYTGGALLKSVALATAPTTVGVDRTGKLVVVGDDVHLRWLDPTLPTPTVTSTAAPFPIGDVAVTSTQYAVLFPAGTATYYLEILDPSSSGLTSSGRNGRFGAASLTADGRLFVNDTGSSDLVEYTVGKTGPTPSLTWVRTNASYSCAGRLWSAASGNHLFDACGSAYTTAALAFTKPLLGASAARHVHSASSGAPIALDTPGTTLLRYDASFDPHLEGNEVIPVWGFDGTPHQAVGKFAFTSADGATRWVIVESNGRTGLVTYP